MPQATAPKYTWDQIADQLVSGYWRYNDEPERAFHLAADRKITFDFSALAPAEKFLARNAMDAWSAATGIAFVNINKTTGSYWAQIYFDNQDDGAYANSDVDMGVILSSYVNIASDWEDAPKSLNSYWFYTYIHEIGHALGLGHAGNYNGTVEWGPDTLYKNDSWQASVMSYFSQEDNPNVAADFAYPVTLRPADVLAIRRLYGTDNKAQLGDTIYGFESNAKAYLGKLFNVVFQGDITGKRYDLGNPMAFTLVDDGGRDTVDFSNLKWNQQINLMTFGASSVGSLKGFMSIAPGTVIENAKAGRGNDKVLGNAANNRLDGGNGDDTLRGFGGDDTLIGGKGRDVFDGGSGSDWLSFEGAETRIRIDLHKELQNGGPHADSVLNIENLIGGKRNDRFDGDEGNNHLKGKWGFDALHGHGGDDTLKGGARTDRLLGNEGADVIFGGQGDDRMNGGSGNDTLVGDGGRDHFVFSGGEDIVRDFEQAVDDLSLSRRLWGGEQLNGAEVIAQFGNLSGTVLQLDFGGGNVVTLRGVVDAITISDDIFVY